MTFSFIGSKKKKKNSLVYIWDTSTCSDGSHSNCLALGPTSTSASQRREQPTKSIFCTNIFKLLQSQINVNTVGFDPRTCLSNAFNHSKLD